LNNLTKSVLITTWILGSISFVIWSWNSESSLCDDYKTIFNTELKAKIIDVGEKFKKDDGRMTNYIIVKNTNDRIDTINYINNNDLLIGDSVFKQNKSLIFKFYRKDSLLYEGDHNRNCSYVKEN